MQNMQTVLLTGGLGYIGSHTAVELIEEGYDVIIVDDLSNSNISVADRIEEITGTHPKVYVSDVTDKEAVDVIFGENDIDVVIHFAGFKAVGESVTEPLKYYRNNLDSAMTILESMAKQGVSRFVFSSSATVYGSRSEDLPFRESLPAADCTNAYGWTKRMIEQILEDCSKANEELSVIILRYFNPIGAHESGLIGERPNGIPNNLMPYITQTAIGLREELKIFGNDYDTEDGTGVRDFIHVVDLAKGHVAAVSYSMKHEGTEIFNLGTGHGTSVLELVNTFREVNGVNIPYSIVGRRSGDVAACYADVSKASEILNWKAEKNVADMCRDSWRWEKNRKG